MNSAPLQSSIAKIRHLLSEVSEVLNDSMPENPPNINKLHDIPLRKRLREKVLCSLFICRSQINLLLKNGGKINVE